MRNGLAVGDQAELIWQVGAEHVIHLGTQRNWTTGSSGVVVFSTPNMILLMERTARKVLEPFLDPEEESVGAAVSVEHLAGTPIGGQVRGVARVTQIDRRVIDFDIAAFDAFEQIGRGTHRRAVVPIDRLQSKLAPKLSSQTLGKVLPMQMEPNTGTLPNLETLDVEVRGAVALVILNRPTKLNAVNKQMTDEWEKVIAWLAGHQEIRVVVVTGRGEAFCAGDDVIEVGKLPIDEARQLSYRQARMYLAWEQLPQVFIAAVNGVALGAGCVAACACDFRLASHNARFGMPEILLGWPPGYGIAQLTSLVGKSRAMEMCVTGNQISAQQAQDIGLALRTVPQAQLLTESMKFAESLLKLPAAALRETKRLVHLDEGVQPKSAYLADTAAYIRCLAEPAAREGIAAFAEKRSPRFE